jgi:hypothetical protein
MKTDAQKAHEGNAQLTEKEVKLSEGQTVTRKKQKKSTSYALKAIRSHIDTLNDDKLITKEDSETILEIVKKAAEKFVKREYGIE